MDIEALNAVMDLLNQTHEFGESIWSRIEFWTGISFGMIALAYIAPNRLTPATTVLVVLLYIGFSVSVVSNIQTDLERAEVYGRDAVALAEEKNIKTGAVELTRQYMISGGSKLEAFSFIYIPGLLLGTIGYLCWTSYSYHVRTKRDS